MDNVLAGQVALVTGAGRGFGAGIARGLARAGARVCIVDVNAGELKATAAEIVADDLVGATGLGAKSVFSRVTDVSNYEQMEETVERIIARWNRLDIVVSNAAIMPLVPFGESDPAFWRTMIDVNLTGVYNGVKAAWPQMMRQGSGHCIAIASGASVRGFVDEVAYCAAKHGIEGFTKALALEALPHNIAVNTIGPGKLIKPTSISRDDEAAVDEETRQNWADPVDLATAFVWLAAQPPTRFTGLRFDAGPIADTIAREGLHFEFAPEKVTLYVEEFVTRQDQRRARSAR